MDWANIGEFAAHVVIGVLGFLALMWGAVAAAYTLSKLP